MSAWQQKLYAKSKKGGKKGIGNQSENPSNTTGII